ncbi:MAG: hypothetical protein QW803_10505 [Candidatus Methanomethylicia archaeon]
MDFMVIIGFSWIYIELAYWFFFDYMFEYLFAIILGASLLVILKYVINVDVSQELIVILIIVPVAIMISWIGKLYFPDLFTNIILLNFIIHVIVGYILQDFIISLLLVFATRSSSKGA